MIVSKAISNLFNTNNSLNQGKGKPQNQLLITVVPNYTGHSRKLPKNKNIQLYISFIEKLWYLEMKVLLSFCVFFSFSVYMECFVLMQVNARMQPSTAAWWRDWSCAMWICTNTDAAGHVHRMPTPPSGRERVTTLNCVKQVDYMRWMTGQRLKGHHLQVDASRTAHM